MRRGTLAGARAVLLLGPTALAFFAGGYFDSPRVWAGLIAWLLVAVALAASAPLPRGRAALLTLGGLGLLAAWTLVSITWAGIAGNAYHAGQRVLLYLGVLLAAALLLRDPRAQLWAEPVLSAGTLIVVGYGISERLLPGLLSFSHSVSAQGRLEQPLTYWNAMGELAALGFVLSARLAGDAARPRWLRAASIAAAAPLGLGLYLSFSRGALFAGAAGLVTVLVLAPTREQLRALILAVLAGALAAAASAPLRGVTALGGSLGTRETQGAVTLALLAMIAAAGALVHLRMTRGEASSRLALPRATPWIAVGVIVAGLALAVVVGAKEKSSRPLGPGATRLVTLQSNRYAYWRVAMRAFRDEPLRGVGAGNWTTYWLRYRPIDEFAQDAHSLPLQTLAELGIVGAALLLAFLAGVALAARDALRAAPALAAGPAAAFTTWVAHAPLDWDWQMPAVTLVAIVLAGALVALGQESDGVPGAARAPRRSEALPA